MYYDPPNSSAHHRSDICQLMYRRQSGIQNAIKNMGIDEDNLNLSYIFMSTSNDVGTDNRLLLLWK